jgi:hypothetical protein
MKKQKRKAVMAKPTTKGRYQRPSEEVASAAKTMHHQFKVLVEGDRLSELKVNTPGLIYYFGRRYAEKTGGWFPMSTIVWTKDGSQLKRTILDDMNMHGITVEEMKEFVDWIFEEKPRAKWKLEMIRFFYRDWIAIKTKGQKARFAEARDQKASEEHTKAGRRLEEKQFLEFVVEGYSDHKLTRRRYALALNWRARHLSPEDRLKISQRQIAEYSEDMLLKLARWRNEIEEIEITRPVAYNRLYVVELARYRETTVKNALEYFFREDLKPLFSEEELNTKTLDEIPFDV